MTTFIDIFGQGRDLTALQMSLRALVVFLFALLLIRIAGRRSTGMRAPFDNIILILLGAILCQGVVGASPFFSTLAAGFTISVLHRLLGLVSIFSPTIAAITKGTTVLLYQNGKFNKPNQTKCLVSEEDIMEEVRLRTHINALGHVETIYMERNGEISTVKK